MLIFVIVLLLIHLVAKLTTVVIQFCVPMRNNEISWLPFLIHIAMATMNRYVSASTSKNVYTSVPKDHRSTYSVSMHGCKSYILIFILKIALKLQMMIDQTQPI